MKALFFLLFLTGCEYGPVNFHCELEDGCSYTADASPTWLKEATINAVEFWNDHGVNITYAETGGMPVVLAPVDVNGGRCWFSQVEQKIVINPLYDEIYSGWKTTSMWLPRKCTVAHEMGHSFGLAHIPESDEGLMSPKVGVDTEVEDCAWAKGDQLNLDELMKEQGD